MTTLSGIALILVPTPRYELGASCPKFSGRQEVSEYRRHNRYFHTIISLGSHFDIKNRPNLVPPGTRPLLGGMKTADMSSHVCHPRDFIRRALAQLPPSLEAYLRAIAGSRVCPIIVHHAPLTRQNPPPSRTPSEIVLRNVNWKPPHSQFVELFRSVIRVVSLCNLLRSITDKIRCLPPP